MNSNNKRLLSLIVGLVLIIISFALTGMDCLRAILCITGIILLTYSNSIERKHKKWFRRRMHQNRYFNKSNRRDSKWVFRIK